MNKLPAPTYSILIQIIADNNLHLVEIQSVILLLIKTVSCCLAKMGKILREMKITCLHNKHYQKVNLKCNRSNDFSSKSPIE